MLYLSLNRMCVDAHSAKISHSYKIRRYAALPLFKPRTILSFAVCLPLLISAISYGQQKGQKAQIDPKNFTAEQVADTVIYAYGGRDAFNNVRVNGIERANVTLPSAGGDRQGQL